MSNNEEKENMDGSFSRKQAVPNQPTLLGAKSFQNLRGSSPMEAEGSVSSGDEQSSPSPEQTKSTSFPPIGGAGAANASGSAAKQEDVMETAKKTDLASDWRGR
eukprot:gb/GECG01005007.1/.p1 GENE.gb/GECG01005007.1/~~gb/GECG01005007.1/.p1  ORF type:complete len:104 (+),score=24.28 gb/GECG01005007.1/:1-312(+)